MMKIELQGRFTSVLIDSGTKERPDGIGLPVSADIRLCKAIGTLYFDCISKGENGNAPVYVISHFQPEFIDDKHDGK